MDRKIILGSFTALLLSACNLATKSNISNYEVAGTKTNDFDVKAFYLSVYFSDDYQKPESLKVTIKQGGAFYQRDCSVQGDRCNVSLMGTSIEKPELVRFAGNKTLSKLIDWRIDVLHKGKTYIQFGKSNPVESCEHVNDAEGKTWTECLIK